MKEKDIRKIIRREIESHIPKNAPKIDFEFVESKAIMKQHWFKLFHFKLVFSSVFVIAIAIISYNLIMRQDTPKINAYQFSSDEEIISFSAISTTAMLNTFNIEQMSHNSTALLSSHSNQIKVIEIIEPYLDLAEKFLNEDAILVTTSTSELEEYEFKIAFQMVDIIGKPSTYVMHYNIVSMDEDDEESEYEFEGVLWVGQLSYNFYGKKEIEEDEEKFEFKASLDDLNYVESSYEFDYDDQEKKFKFKSYVNGLLLSESKIKIVIENDKTKFDLEFIEGNNQGEFEFEYVTIDQVDVIKIEFEAFIDNAFLEGEMIVRVTIDPVTNETSYSIYIKTNDKEASFDRRRKDDDDDESDPTDPSEPTETEDIEESEPTETEEIEESDPTEVEEVEESEPTEPEEEENESDETLDDIESEQVRTIKI